MGVICFSFAATFYDSLSYNVGSSYIPLPSKCPKSWSVSPLSLSLFPLSTRSLELEYLKTKGILCYKAGNGTAVRSCIRNWADKWLQYSVLMREERQYFRSKGRKQGWMKWMSFDHSSLLLCWAIRAQECWIEFSKSSI